MTTLMKYRRPYSLLDNFFSNDLNFNDFNFNDLTRSFLGRDNSVGHVNITETDKTYNIDVLVPGFKKEEINIELEDGMLTIRADKKSTKDDTTKNYIRKEYVSTSFSRSFSLPDDVKDEVLAEFSDGILKISVDKILEEEKPKKTKTIEIK